MNNIIDRREAIKKFAAATVAVAATADTGLLALASSAVDGSSIAWLSFSSWAGATTTTKYANRRLMLEDGACPSFLGSD